MSEKKEFYHWFEEINFFPELKKTFLAIIIDKKRKYGRVCYLEPDFLPVEDNHD